jgi:hypothetical protein
MSSNIPSQLFIDIKNAFKKEITAYMTIGMKDNNKKSFTEEQINDFLKNNDELLIKLTLEMYKDNNKDGEEEYPYELDWYREYLRDEKIYQIIDKLNKKIN